MNDSVLISQEPIPQVIPPIKVLTAEEMYESAQVAFEPLKRDFKDIEKKWSNFKEKKLLQQEFEEIVKSVNDFASKIKEKNETIKRRLNQTEYRSESFFITQEKERLKKSCGSTIELQLENIKKNLEKGQLQLKFQEKQEQISKQLPGTSNQTHDRDKEYEILHKQFRSIDEGLENAKNQLDNKQSIQELDQLSNSLWEFKAGKNRFVNSSLFKEAQNSSDSPSLPEFKKEFQELKLEKDNFIEKTNQEFEQVEKILEEEEKKIYQENLNVLTKLICISQADREDNQYSEEKLLKYQQLAELCFTKLPLLLLNPLHSILNANEEIKEIEKIKSKFAAEKDSNVMNYLIFNFSEGIIAGLKCLKEKKQNKKQNLDLEKNSSFEEIVEKLKEQECKNSLLANDILAICYGHGLGVEKHHGDEAKCEKQVEQIFKDHKVFCFPLFLSLKLQLLFTERFNDLSQLSSSEIKYRDKYIDKYRDKNFGKSFTPCYFPLQLYHQFIEHKDDSLKGNQLIPLLKFCCFFDKLYFLFRIACCDFAVGNVDNECEKAESLINQWWASSQDQIETIFSSNSNPLTMDQKLEIGKALACLYASKIETQPGKKKWIKIWRKDFWKSNTNEEEFKIQLKMLKLERCHQSLIPKKTDQNKSSDQDRDEKEWIKIGNDWIKEKTDWLKAELSKHQNNNNFNSENLYHQLHTYQPFFEKFAPKNLESVLQLVFENSQRLNDFMGYCQNNPLKPLLKARSSSIVQWVESFVKNKSNNFWERYRFYIGFELYGISEFKSEEAYINQLHQFTSSQLNEFLNNQGISSDRKVETILPLFLKLQNDNIIQQVWEKALESNQLKFVEYLRILEYAAFHQEQYPSYKFFKHCWLNSEKVWNDLNSMLKKDSLLEKIPKEQILLLFQNSLYYIIKKGIFNTRPME